MGKNSSIAFLVVGIIAFLGDVAFMLMLVQFGGALGTLANANPSEIPNAGVPIAETQEFARQLMFFVNIGWVWAIAVLVVSVAMTYYSAIDLWGKKKK